MVSATSPAASSLHSAGAASRAPGARGAGGRNINLPFEIAMTDESFGSRDPGTFPSESEYALVNCSSGREFQSLYR